MSCLGTLEVSTRQRQSQGTCKIRKQLLVFRKAAPFASEPFEILAGELANPELLELNLLKSSGFLSVMTHDEA